MKRFIIALIGLFLLMLACTPTGIPATNTPQPPATQPPTQLPVTQPPATQLPTQPPTQPPTQVPIETQPPQPNATCDIMSIYLYPALASSFDCAIIPEANYGGPVTNPQYPEMTLHGYPLSGRFFEPRIDVFSVSAYAALMPDYVNMMVPQLQALISGGATSGSTLPLLEPFNAAQEFHAQYNVINFGSGTGIRYITQYAQYFDPINNHEMFYTFQGLTTDGNYWVSVILPITNPILPEDSQTLPGGYTQDQFSAQFPTYIEDITNQLNAQPGDSFTPTLSALDALVGSIVIQP